MSVLDELEFTTAERVKFCGNLLKHSPHDTGPKNGCPGTAYDVLHCGNKVRHVPHLDNDKRCLGNVREGVARVC